LAAVQTNFFANAWVVRAGRTKWGSREQWGAIEYTQAAIAALYPTHLPPLRAINKRDLRRRVVDWLKNYSEYPPHRYNNINLSTVNRALKKFREANKLDE
jgi:hypothetical protein